ncbi:segregation and condensation protein A [Robiginitomaculum antarcticum]|uniref:segregation and condensation protein A n=1 Tax=Robiginitomaculum antarcticum TaxID=437507 RepID=UPI000374ECF8|nr:ScpA family protein [Robiginitomaculum antarcticum]
MAEVFQDDLDFQTADEAYESGEALILDIDGYEGPLHLLLELARKQKVDLARLSILELAEQYIAFIKAAQNMRIELAADYLVMAAWLAYLKSRLILPKDDTDAEPLEEEVLAAHLAFRLQRLDAMRRAADALFSLPQIGQNIHSRGAPEGLRSRTSPLYEAEIFDLLKAYGEIRSQNAIKKVTLRKPIVFALEEARSRLSRAIGKTLEWLSLDALLPTGIMIGDETVPRRSVMASSFLAGLELAKEGEIDIRQSGEFAPIFVRARVKSPGKDES